MPAIAIHNGLLRRLYPSDAAAFAAHLLRLDAQTRHERFGMSVSDHYVATYAAACFGSDDVVYGFFVAGLIRAAGELRQITREPAAALREAEAAFSVEPDWRRHGIGTALMARIVRAAQNRRDATLYMLCLAQNQAMQGLARKFSAELQFGTDEVTGRLVARHISPLSLLGEAVDDASGLIATLLEARQRRQAIVGS